MKISKKRLLHILDVLEIEGIDYLAHTIKKEWYPEVFREKMDGWYGDTRDYFSKVLVFFEDDKPLYGFNASGTYRHVGTITMGEEHRKFMVKATDGVVEYHLTTEAKRRYPVSCHIETFRNVLTQIVRLNDPVFHYKLGTLACVNENRVFCLFHKGQWAEVIETISKEEAEKQLGKKIV